MIKTFKQRAVIALLLAGFSTSVFAQSPMPDGAWHGRGKGGMPPIPGLTQDQKQKIADLKTATTQQAAPIREQIVTVRKAIRALWTADTLDRSAIAAKRAEQDALVAKIKGLWTEFFFQLHGVLTPAQRSWLAQHGPGSFGHDGGACLGEAAEQE
jgi:Spy/CpxP family protein refolding chaperone